MGTKTISQENPKRSALRKRVLRVLGLSLLTILTLEFTLYFGSNLFLGNLLRKKLNESFNGVYELEFNRVHLSLIRRGIIFDGIVMQPIHLEKAGSEQVLFELTLDELSFTGLWYGLQNQKLYVREVWLDRPNFKVVSSPSHSVSQQAKAPQRKVRSPIALLENELRKSIKNLPLAGIHVGRVLVNQAQVFFLNFLSQQELLAKEASFTALDLNWTPNQPWETPFNARGFEFELEGVTYALPDGIHQISSKKVFISSLEETIELQEFKLVPDLSQASSTYYSLALAKLQLRQVDLNEAFRSAKLDLEELILVEPQIEVIQSSFPAASSQVSGDLHAFIRGKLNQLTIKEFAIQKGSFLKKDKEDSLRNRIQLDDLDLKMVNFYLGQDSLRREQQFFYGSDASLAIAHAVLFLGDGIHSVEGENLEASTFKNELNGTKIKLMPRDLSSLNTINQPSYQLDLAEFTFGKVDLKKWYSKGELEIETLFLKKPQLLIRETNSSHSNSENTSFIPLLNGIVNRVAIQSFKIEEGTLVLNEESGVKSTDLDLGKFSLALEKLQLEPKKEASSIQQQLQFAEVLLTLYDYRLKLRDNLHEFLAEELSIDSKSEWLEIKNLRIQPADSTHIEEQLQVLGKTTAVNFSVPFFRANGVGFVEALFEQKLRLNHLQLDLPRVHWYTYRSRESKASESALGSAEDLKALLLGYFEDIEVDSVSISNAKIRYVNGTKEAVTKFEEDQLFFKLKNFALHKNGNLSENRALFSDEVNLTFNSYTFSLAGGKYLVDTDFLNYNSRTRTLDFENLRLLPGKVEDRRLALGFNFPKVAFRGVNLEEFIFDNVLDLEKLEIDGGEISVGLDPQVRTSSKLALQRKKLALERAVERIHIDTISSENATLQLNFLNQNQSKKGIKTGFGLYITQFDLDSLRVRTQDLSKTYQGVNLGLTNFEFTLPDSVHTLKFDAFGFGDNQEELIFSGLSIHPKNNSGTSGIPVFDGKIERVVLKKNSMLDILNTKKVDLREVRIQNPSLSIFLDSLPIPKTNGLDVTQEKPARFIQSLVLGDLVVENGKFDFFRKGGQALPNLSFPQVDARLAHLGIDVLAMGQLPTWQVLFSKISSFNLSNYQAYLQDSAYLLWVDRLQFMDQDLRVHGLNYRPVKGIYGYLSSLPFQHEAVTAQIKELEFQGIELQKLGKEYLINGDLLRLESARVDLFRDKRKPMDPLMYKPMPQYLVENAPLNLDLSSFQIRDSRLRYWEFGQKSTLPGRVAFQNVQLDLAPLFLRRQGQSYPISSLRLGISAQMSDSSQLQVRSQLYFEQDYPMEVAVELDRFAFAEAEDFLSKTAFVRPLAGGVSHGAWQFRLDEQVAVGSMALAYEGLKFQLLDSLTLVPGKGKLKLYSFLANSWAKKSNPPAGTTASRRREIYQLRDPQRSVVNAWWKATYAGLKSSIGFGKSKVPKNIRKEDDN